MLSSKKELEESFLEFADIKTKGKLESTESISRLYSELKEFLEGFSDEDEINFIDFTVWELDRINRRNG